MNFSKRSYTEFQSQANQSDSLMRVSEHELGSRFRSKKDLYIYLTEIRIMILHLIIKLIVGLYVPPLESLNKDYLKLVLRNHKKLLKMNEVKMIKVPKYEELSVKSIYPQVMEDETLRLYFPDLTGKSKPIDRQFFFNVLNTLQHDYVKELIEAAQKQRNSPSANEEKKDYILVADDWYSMLMKKQGKTLQLLKESTKIYKGRKPRQKKESPITLKRFKREKSQRISCAEGQSHANGNVIYNEDEVQDNSQSFDSTQQQQFMI